MSGNVDDEAKARLDVAELYENMKQLPKAIRYFLEAANIYAQGGVPGRAKELFQKVLALDPDNATAQTELAKLFGGGGGAAPAAAPSAEGQAAAPAAPAAAAAPKPPTPGQLPPLQLPKPQPGKVLVPTPWLFRDPRYVAAAKKQLQTAITREELHFDPLPKVDPQTVMLKQEQRKAKEEELARRATGRQESAFSNTIAPRFGGSIFAKKEESAAAAPAQAAPVTPAAPAPPTSRFGLGGGGGRSGNQDLAEQIRKRMLERGK